MKQSRSFAANMHIIDRLLRFVIGLACLYAGFYDWGLIPNSVVSILVGCFGVMNLASAVVGVCPVYWLGGIRTNRTVG